MYCGLPAVIAAMLAAILCGCIKNDIPYPKIPLVIYTLAAEGESAPALIDSATYTATIYLEETTDIEAVRFSDYTFSEGAVSTPDLREGTYNLKRPITVTLELYQQYQWIVKAEQNIERYFTVEGQIGSTVIDAVGQRVIVRVPQTADLSRLRLTSVKLGPAGITTLSPDLQPGEIDLSKPLDVDVTYHGRTEEWTIYAERTAQTVSMTAADAWSQVIWLYGSGPAGVRNTFEWKKEGDADWTRIPVEEVTQTEGAFSACLRHVAPLTRYQVRAVSGENTSSESIVTTEATEILPAADFDNWWLKNGKIWCPWAEDGVQYWDTGNTGAATLGESNVQPSDDVPAGITGKSAKLETRFVGIGIIGKLAAGSIYTGSFKKVDGTNGILDFGRPWTLRPTKLKGYYKFHSEPINYASSEWSQLKGRPDSCHIYIALTDWTAPYEVRTNPKNRQLFDSRSEAVIGYGELVRGNDTNGWEEFEIEINYRSTSRRPRYIQVTAAASKYGDYFTGGTGTVLFVDQFSLSYE